MKRTILFVFLFSLSACFTMVRGQEVGYLMYVSENKPCETGSFRNHYAYEFRTFPDFATAKAYYENFESRNRTDPSHFFGVDDVRKGQYYAVILITQTFSNNCQSGQQFRKAELHTSTISIADAKQKAEKWYRGKAGVLNIKYLAEGRI
ncbi:hypothetical protein [Cyclobacterium xiamenense]|uniref:hypothetical protein n=1 Tax=Cyclobacterium xiamenense TaxID=1297121 RepID=UPI0035D0274F